MKFEEILVGRSYACGGPKAIDSDFPQVKRVLVLEKTVTKAGRGKLIRVNVVGGEEALLRHTSFLVEWGEFERVRDEKHQAYEERLRQREIRQQHLDDRVKAVMSRLRGLGMSHYVSRNCPRSDVTIEVEVLEKLLDRVDLLAQGANPTLY